MQNLMNQLLAYMQVGVMINVDGQVAYANPEMVRIFGGAEEGDVIGQDVVRFMCPEELELIRQRHRCLMEEGMKTVEMYEYCLRRLDGTLLMVQAQGIRVIYEEQPAVAVIVTDVTERNRQMDRLRLAESRLRENIQRYQSLFQYSPDLIASFDAQSRFQSINPAGAAVLGYSEAEILGRPRKDFLNPGDMELAYAYFQKALQGEPQTYEARLNRPDGTHVDLLFTNIPITVDGEIVGVYGIAKDITEHKKAQELLRRSEKMSVIGELAAGVAHEIRNPLTSLKGFIHLLKNGVNRRTYFDVIEAEIGRIEQITSEMLVLAKPQAVRFQKANLHDLMLHVTTLLETQAILHGVQIQVDFENGQLDVDCDANQLKQVFLNLVKNAIEAMSSGGTVTVQGFRNEQGQVVLRFIDKGCGIPKSLASRLGEPFYTTKEKGTGLGLMVSYKIIETHRGTMKIESEENQGTTIEIVLPGALGDEESGLM